MTCLKSGTHNILKWQICYSVFILFTWLRKWPLLLFIAAICWSNSFQCNQVRNLFFFFFGGLVFFFHLFCSVFNYYCLWNLIPGFQISEWDKPFSHSYNGCLKNSLFACLQVVKKKKINKPTKTEPLNRWALSQRGGMIDLKPSHNALSRSTEDTN